MNTHLIFEEWQFEKGKKQKNYKKFLKSFKKISFSIDLLPVMFLIDSSSIFPKIKIYNKNIFFIIFFLYEYQQIQNLRFGELKRNNPSKIYVFMLGIYFFPFQKKMFELCPPFADMSATNSFFYWRLP